MWNKKPNVIFFFLDQLRNDCRGAHPFFNRLAGEATLFSQMITYAPYTVAAVPAILTGSYGTRNGVDAYYKAKAFDRRRAVSIAEVLRHHGYRTEADSFREFLIQPAGFDRVSMYDENDPALDLTSRHRALMEQAARGNKPFFLMLHYGLIHRDVVQGVIKQFGEYDEQFFGRMEDNRRRYEKSVSSAGDYLTVLWDAARSLALAGRTLFVFFTDHGSSLGEQPGERAYGVYLREYTIRTWAYFVGLDAFPPRREISLAVRTIDIHPTVVEALGLTYPDKRRPQGRSLLGMARGEETQDREAYVETGGLDGPHPSTHEPNLKAVRTAEWKLVYHAATLEKSLYHLPSDPEEARNVIDAHPDVARSLWDRLVHYGEETAWQHPVPAYGHS